jgi:hypothetical protein
MAQTPGPQRPSLPRVYDEGWLVGKLLDHGKAPYRHEPAAPQSYFVRIRMLETEQGAAAYRAHREQGERPVDGRTAHHVQSLHDGGVVERWGNDLERAIRDSRSRVQVGQTVAVKIVARNPLISATPADQGRREGPRYWNRWEVETVQYVAQRNRFAHAINENRRNARGDGVDGKEALAIYLIHEGAERLAAARYPNANDRKAFVDRVRNFLEVSPERERVIANAVARIQAHQEERSKARSNHTEAPTRE